MGEFHTVFVSKVSNFVEDEPVEIIHDDGFGEEQEVNDEGYFYEDIVDEDEGFVSEGPWIETPNEYSSSKPHSEHPETFFVETGKNSCKIRLIIFHASENYF